MKPLLDDLKDRTDERTYSVMRQEYYLKTNRWTEARDVLESMWKANPLDPFTCNNLAWVYAMLGERLDRAEELANAATVLSADESSSMNTLGAVYARRGDWKKARSQFDRALHSNDRPSSRLANEFFLGLSDYELGHPDRAVARWRRIAVERRKFDACEWAKKALALHKRGMPVASAVFVDDTDATH